MNRLTTNRFTAWLTLLLMWAALHLAAATSVSADDPNCVITGLVLDAQTDAPISGAVVQIGDRSVTVRSDATGLFRLTDLSPGDYRISVSLVAFAPVSRQVTVTAGDTVSLTIVLQPRPVDLGSLDVLGEIDRSRDFTGQRPVRLTGDRLRESLGSTVAETLADAPGVDLRSMGPAPARPVLRGLGGNRLLITENGRTTGDLSATAADHAVTIDPIGSSRLEVIRGPAALMYGSNALAGVVDVFRPSFPTSSAARVDGTISVQGESVNKGAAGDANFLAPVGPLMLLFDASGRRSSDITTPSGELGNSQIRTASGTVGASWISDNSLIGASSQQYESRYGIPGGFLGGHPNGVTIDLERTSFAFRAERHFPERTIRQAWLEYSYNRYFHEELESNGACGVSFGVLTYSLRGEVRLDRLIGTGQTVIGFDASLRDYAQGCLSFVRPTEERAVAGFVYHETEVLGLATSATLRFDHSTVDPELPAGLDADTTKAGPIISRDFSGLSAGLELRRPVSSFASLGAAVMLTRSHPATEELYSDGPHLASYAYEVGNTSLEAEQGLGLELNGTLDFQRFSAGLAVFRNDINNYIYPRNTGDLEWGPGEEGVLERYQYQGQDAELVGFEMTLRGALTNWLAAGASASFVRGTLLDDDQPIPFIPPLTGSIWGEVKHRSSRLKATLLAADKQDRVAEFESPTAGYAVLNLSLQHDVIAGSLLHSFVLGVENITDTEYRKHLSRVKSVMPEPGLNISLLYRLVY